MLNNLRISDLPTCGDSRGIAYVLSKRRLEKKYVE